MTKSGEFTHLKANVINDYYKNHLSGFHSWNQKNIQMNLLFMPATSVNILP
ncbi:MULTISPECIES: hypothetical protein [Prevotellaceae]|uniref:hypothetical protein n=1 Tax=Leyella stercorea TaxID=363265 RepID=UPI001F394B74|nr:hypothetical protein [Leyella stercorea]MCF2580216.1 hypothetical protein [Leyella stercorea]